MLSTAPRRPVDSPPARGWVLAKSGLVGVLATAVDLLCLALLVEGLGVAPTVANVPALLAGLAVQFFGNKHFAFGDRSRALLRQGASFAVVEAGALALNALSFHALVTLTPLSWPLARAVGSAAVYFGYSFPLWGRIFRPGRAAPGGAP